MVSLLAFSYSFTYELRMISAIWLRPFADTKQAIMGKYRTLVIRRLFVILQANSVRLRRGSMLLRSGSNGSMRFARFKSGSMRLRRGSELSARRVATLS